MTGGHEWGTAPDFVGPRHRLRETLLLERFLAAEPGRVVLNVGAGQGTFSGLLEQAGFEVTSTDVAPAALDVLRRCVRGPVTQADATSLPFGGKTFDAVVLGEVLEHVERDDLALGEAFRVLGPDGVLAVSVPRNPAWFSASDRWAGHVRRYTREELIGLVERTGFRLVTCTAWGFPISSLYHRTVYEWGLRHGVPPARNGATTRSGLAVLSLLLEIDRRLVGVERGALGYILVARR